MVIHAEARARIEGHYPTATSVLLTTRGVTDGVVSNFTQNIVVNTLLMVKYFLWTVSCEGFLKAYLSLLSSICAKKGMFFSIVYSISILKMKWLKIETMTS